MASAVINRTTLRPELRCYYSAEASAESASAKILTIRFKPNLTYCAEASVFCQSFGDLPCFGQTFGLNIWQNRPKLRLITQSLGKLLKLRLDPKPSYSAEASA